GVVAGLAEEHVVAGPARQGVVAGAAEEVRRRQRPAGLVQRNLVVTTLPKDLNAGRVRDRRRTPLYGDGAAVDEDLAGGVPADDDGVVQGVPQNGQDVTA